MLLGLGPLGAMPAVLDLQLMQSEALRELIKL